jgi:hypothetical protein
MPSFYPRPMPRDLPPTPPEFIPGYNMNGCAGGPYSAGGCAGYPGSGAHETGGYDQADRYGPLPSMPATAIYQHANVSAFINNSVNLPSAARFFNPQHMPLLPPMRTNDPGMMHAPGQQAPKEHTRTEQNPKKEESVGGVSATLDYKLETMTDFVAEMSQGLLAPGMPPHQIPDFKKWVHSVLSATRLPSATIVLSLHYLTVRLSLLSKGGQYHGSTDQIYIMLTIALALGSKFLDDNTFINRSWSDVSGINVKDLNRVELEWLVSMEFNLHRDPNEQQGFNTWLTRWKEYETRAARTEKLAPLDTNVLRPNQVHGLHGTFSPAPAQQMFGKPTVPEFAPKSGHAQFTPTYAYDPWGVSRSATENSPCSAPHTGPTTPEFYPGSGIWGPPEGYSRRTMFGFPPLTQNASQVGGFGQGPFTPQFTPNAWNGHPMGCPCFQCGRQHSSGYFAPGFGAQPVVG